MGAAGSTTARCIWILNLVSWRVSLGRTQALTSLSRLSLLRSKLPLIRLCWGTFTSSSQSCLQDSCNQPRKGILKAVCCSPRRASRNSPQHNQKPLSMLAIQALKLHPCTALTSSLPHKAAVRFLCNNSGKLLHHTAIVELQ